jgi:hypothetical protein
MAEHTKGPWETDGISIRASGENRQIALCEITVRGRPYDETYDEAIANAQLIAAAPDLLEALKMLDERGHTDATWQFAKRAISKATCEHKENSSFVPVPSTGTFVPTKTSKGDA